MSCRTTQDAVGVRRELLAAMRGMVAGPNKACLLDIVDVLLDDNPMLPNHLASMDVLRPVSVMTVCEILHVLRKQLTLHQLGRVVDMLWSYVMDHSLPYGSQATCVRLVLNLVECLYQSFKHADADMEAKVAAQQLLSRILHNFVRKLKSLQVGVPGAAGSAGRSLCKAGEGVGGPGRIPCPQQPVSVPTLPVSYH
jgi:transformation/transcription domain-associated protein